MFTTKSFKKKYDSLFSRLTTVPFIPYVGTAFVSEVLSEGLGVYSSEKDSFSSSTFCILFVFTVIPVLPAATLAATSLAGAAFMLALLSTVVTYPLALAGDAISPSKADKKYGEEYSPNYDAMESSPGDETTDSHEADTSPTLK